jgi:hypothetical protein
MSFVVGLKRARLIALRKQDIADLAQRQ